MCPVRGLVLGQAEKIWSAVTHPDLFNRHKDMAWLIAHGVLSVRAVMFSRRLARTAECPRDRCGKAETVAHVLWDCRFRAALLEAGATVAEAIPEGRHPGRTYRPLRRTEKGPRRVPLEGSLDGAECLPVDLVGVEDAGRPRKQNYFTPAGVDHRKSNGKGLCAERLQETWSAESPGQVGGRGLGRHGYVLLLNSLAVCFVLVEWDRMEAVF